LQAFALVKQARQISVIADQALALNLGRVRSQHRGDHGMGEESAMASGETAAVDRESGQKPNCFARRRTGQIVRATRRM
jgi:hypothetical protein